MNCASSRHVHVSVAVEQPVSEGDETAVPATPSLDYESKLLLNFCRAQEHLINTYSALFALNSAVQEKNDVSNAETLEEVGVMIS